MKIISLVLCNLKIKKLSFIMQVDRLPNSIYPDTQIEFKAFMFKADPFHLSRWYENLDSFGLEDKVSNVFKPKL